MSKELTKQDILIANALLDGATFEVAAKAAGVTSKTVQRRTKEPYFAAYIEKNRPKVQQRLEAKAEEAIEKKIDKEIAKIPFTFSFAEAAIRYNEIYVTSKNDFCRLKAVDSLVALFGIAKPPATTEEQADSAPDVYQAEWMRKPQ